MTTLLIQTLYSELSQSFNYGLNERVHVASIAPYLYMSDAPAGTFTVDLTGPNGVVISKSFTSSDIKTSLSTTDNFAHVFYPIIPENPVHIEYGAYTIKLTATGYTATDSSFIGWIQQHENLNNSLSYTPSDDSKNPLSIRFKIYKEGIA